MSLKYNKVVTWLDKIVERARKGEDPEKLADDLAAVMPYAGLAIRLWMIMPLNDLHGYKLLKIVTKEDTKRPGKITMIVTAMHKRKKMVCFHSGEPDGDLFHTFIERSCQGRLKWKEDTPWAPEVENDEESHLPELGGA